MVVYSSLNYTKAYVPGSENQLTSAAFYTLHCLTTNLTKVYRVWVAWQLACKFTFLDNLIK